MSVALAVDPADFAPATPSPPPQVGPYRLLDRIADGGMASIFRGEDVETGELVALKTVRDNLPCEIDALNREIAALRRLSHPGIVKFLGHGEWNGSPWLALELLHGGTLFDEIRNVWGPTWRDAGSTLDHPKSVAWDTTNSCSDRNVGDVTWVTSLQADPSLEAPKRVPAAGRLEDALTWVVRLAPVIDYIHSRGVVHRDLKPENVFLKGNGQLTLLDFGLAGHLRAIRSRPEPRRFRMGTVEYAAPEQIRGEQVDPRADLYSLGCIMYELVTGHRVFDGPSADDIAQKQLDGAPVAPSELVSGLSWQLEDLILGMLSKDPRRRPRCAGEVAGRLKRLIPRCR